MMESKTDIQKIRDWEASRHTDRKTERQTDRQTDSRIILFSKQFWVTYDFDCWDFCTFSHFLLSTEKIHQVLNPSTLSVNLVCFVVFVCLFVVVFVAVVVSQGQAALSLTHGPGDEFGTIIWCHITGMKYPDWNGHWNKGVPNRWLVHSFFIRIYFIGISVRLKF